MFHQHEVKKALYLLLGLIVAVYILGFFAGKTTGVSGRAQAIAQLNAECRYPYASNGYLNERCSDLIYSAARQGFKPSHATAGPDGSVNWN